MDDFITETIEGRFEGDIAAYRNWQRYGKKETLHWRDIAIADKTYPQHQKMAYAWIIYSLGYLPAQHAILPDLGFIQALIENEGGNIHEKTFSKELLFHLKRIRNRDIITGGWLKTKIPSEQDYAFYESCLPHFREAARHRHAQFLGYEPSIDHSMPAEITIREWFQKMELAIDSALSQFDYHMATITQYRKVFLTEGEEAADNSELVGMCYRGSNDTDQAISQI